MNRIDLSRLPECMENVEPAEITYWAMGVKVRAELKPSTRLARCTSEKAAFLMREQKRHWYEIVSDPIMQTIEEVNQAALNHGCDTVVIFNEAGQVVETWTI